MANRRYIGTMRTHDLAYFELCKETYKLQQYCDEQPTEPSPFSAIATIPSRWVPRAVLGVDLRLDTRVVVGHQILRAWASWGTTRWSILGHSWPRTAEVLKIQKQPINFWFCVAFRLSFGAKALGHQELEARTVGEAPKTRVKPMHPPKTRAQTPSRGFLHVHVAQKFDLGSTCTTSALGFECLYNSNVDS